MKEIKAEIKMKDLDKIDIRVANIETVEDVPASDRLIKMTVDLCI